MYVLLFTSPLGRVEDRSYLPLCSKVGTNLEKNAELENCNFSKESEHLICTGLNRYIYFSYYSFMGQSGTIVLISKHIISV